MYVIISLDKILVVARAKIDCDSQKIHVKSKAVGNVDTFPSLLNNSHSFTFF